MFLTFYEFPFVTGKNFKLKLDTVVILDTVSKLIDFGFKVTVFGGIAGVNWGDGCVHSTFVK